MTNDTKDGLGILFVIYITINGMVSIPFFMEKPLTNSCHSPSRIEYIFPSPRFACEIGGVLDKGLNWLFSEPGK